IGLIPETSGLHRHNDRADNREYGKVNHSIPVIIRTCSATGNMASDNSPFIDILAASCVVTFKVIYSQLNTELARPYVSDISAADIQDELGRFKLWAGNVAALHPKESRSSLEYRLSDASRTR